MRMSPFQENMYVIRQQFFKFFGQAIAAPPCGLQMSFQLKF